MGRGATERCALLSLARSITHKEEGAKAAPWLQRHEAGGKRVLQTPSTQQWGVLNLPTPYCLQKGSITSNHGDKEYGDGLALCHKGITLKH